MRVHRAARQQAMHPSASQRSRRAAAAGVLVVGGLLVAALAVPAAAQAARPVPVDVASFAQAAAQAAPATTSVGQAKFTVSPATDIKVRAKRSTAITVTGTGLDPKLSLEIAVCQRDSGAPQDLTRCLGGPIPDDNATTSWAVISSNQDKTPPGPVQGAIDDGGKFSVTLQLPGIADAAADCQSAECSVVIRDQSSQQGVLVPVTFNAPGGGPSQPSSTSAASTTPSSTTPTSTSPTSTTPTPTSTTPTSTTPTSTTPTSTTPTSTTPTTTAPVPTTVDAVSILVPRVQAGASQVVVFDGFTPGESVAASVAGNPQVKFPALTADDNGLVRVEWAVPADFPAARYSLRVEGAESLRVGVADFQVLALIVPPSSASSASSVSAPSSTPSSTPSTTSSASSTASRTTVSSSTASAASSSTAVSTTDSAAGPVTTSSTPWWLWITLGLLLIAGLVVAAVLMGRQHRQQALGEQQARERPLASAAEAQSLIPMPPTPAPPTPPAGLGEYAEDPQRPILFSHRQAENYTPPTDPIGDAPTQQIDPRGLPTQAIPPEPGSGSARKPMADPGPATGAWTPDFAAGPPPVDPGPGTQQFNPFADDADVPGDPAASAPAPAPDPGPGTQKFDPFADDPDPAASAGVGPDAADQGDEPGPKHSADDWDTPPPPR